jgi:hypothetical protein
MKRWGVDRWLYALELTILGLPALAICIVWLFFGFLGMVLVVPHLLTSLPDVAPVARWDFLLLTMLIVALVVGGATGLASWSVLSAHYLSSDPDSLADVDDGWWGGLVTGMFVAVILLALCFWNDGLRALQNARWSWLAGPAFLVLATHLLLVKPRR